MNAITGLTLIPGTKDRRNSQEGLQRDGKVFT